MRELAADATVKYRDAKKTGDRYMLDGLKNPNVSIEVFRVFHQRGDGRQHTADD